MVVLPPVDEPADYNDNYILYWNWTALDLNRLTHSIGGPQGGPVLSARALAILHIAIHDAYFAIKPPSDGSFKTYLDPNATDPKYRLPAIGKANGARQAVAGAAITVLEWLYTTPDPKIAFNTTFQLKQYLKSRVNSFVEIDALSESYAFGIAVGKLVIMLLISPNEPGADQGSYRPKQGLYKFRDEPNNPVRIIPVNPNDPKGSKQAAHIYYAPFYGLTAQRVAVQMKVDGQSTEHIIADPPMGSDRVDTAEYNDALLDVRRMGGQPALNDTKRRPDQTASAYFWAYDGANLIGTPPRLYNQILRKLAFTKKLNGTRAEATNAEFARLFALANAAMADAGTFCWREKYEFELWRPLSGVREEPNFTGPNALGDPFFQSLGAPETNSNNISFKPPFPAYPSGHATFGAAVFQVARLFYKKRDGLTFADDAPDAITVEFVSDEMNGVNRDLRQPYDASEPITNQVGTVRTKVERKFGSLWELIFDNAISRIWLGVHWRFDAFAAADALVPDPSGVGLYTLAPDGTTAYKNPADIRYKTMATRHDKNKSKMFPIGGVPLGLQIANDIWQGNLRPTPPELQPNGPQRA